jgi:hypothetical protein
VACNLVLDFDERRANDFVAVLDVENLRGTAVDVEKPDASVAARRAAKKRRGMKVTDDLRVLNESMKKSGSDSY